MSDTTGMDMPSSAYLSQLIGNTGFVHLILAAAKLGIADLLKNGPLTIDELAEATGTHSRSLYRMLRALASRSIFCEDADGRFSLTALADPLRSDAPDSIRTLALFVGSDADLQTSANLSYSLRTGKPAFEHIFGEAWFDYLDEQPEMAKIFNDLMTGGSTSDAKAIIEAHDFSVYRKIVDVGGGHGVLLAHILEQYTQTSGVLFDAPSVISGANGAIDDHLAHGRVEKVVGNFFEEVPNGGDAYILKSIVHDWNDEKAIIILKNCRKAMAKNGRVLLVEIVIPARNVPSPAKFLDITMLLYFHSRERTEAEYSELLQLAGLKLVKITSTASPYSIIEAEPA